MLLTVDTQDLERAGEQLWSWLEPDLRHLDTESIEEIHLAFMQMVESHGQQRRKSGEFYIIHPVAACKTLAKINLDKATLIACLLHDVPEDTDTTLATVQKNFGSEVAFLVNGITKIGAVKYRGNQRYAENLRKMFIAMSQDLRVVFIKLADRIHNLETIEHVRPDKAQRIAMESVDIYSRIAERLGMDMMQGRIEDLCFPVLYPEVYKSFIEASELQITKRKRSLDQLQTMIEQLLEEQGFRDFIIKGRAKRYYSIYQKMRKGKQLEDVYDLIAIRIITNSVSECYEIFSLINNRFDSVEGRIKDYIFKPKPNGYQSLHSTIKIPATGEFFEIQIRTHEMHEYAEFGVAAHWAYKQGGAVSNMQVASKWIQELVDLGHEPLSDEEYLQRVKLDLYNDRIFVMTPNNDPIDLPNGATCLDFAFRIHESLGLHASMAKVNGQPHKLNTPLKSGDMVEIIANKKQQPKPDWLNYVTTANAARKIRNRLRKLGHQI